MNPFAALYLLPPVSLVVPLALLGLWVAAAMPRHRRGAAGICRAIAVVALLATFPVVSKLLVWPLTTLVTDWDDAGLPPVGAVVVPTGGSFSDAAGGRWPSRETVRRAATGAAVAGELGLPLAISGGSPEELPASEAALVADLLDLDRSAVLLDLAARNTHENAQAFARLLHPRGIRAVLAVTDVVHLPRFAASLRTAGFTVYGRTLGLGIDAPIEPADFAPSNRGLDYFGGLAAGYGGIIYYLIRGRFAFRDLADPPAAGTSP